VTVTANADEDEILSTSVCFRDSRQCIIFLPWLSPTNSSSLWVYRQGSRGRQTTSSRISLSQGFLEKSQHIQVSGTQAVHLRVLRDQDDVPLYHLWTIEENGVGNQQLEKGNGCNYVQKKKKNNPRTTGW